MQHYHIKPGDMLYQELTNAYGIVFKKTGSTVHYALRSPSTETNEIVVNVYKVKDKTVYKTIDEGNLKIYYGEKKNRRKRKVV